MDEFKEIKTDKDGIPIGVNELVDGYYMGTVKIGPKGQIVIPKEVRDMFNVGPGDTLIMLADKRRGIAMQKQDMIKPIVEGVLKATSEEREKQKHEQ